MPYLSKLGTLISQCINALIFQGHPDESLSARSYFGRERSRFWAFIYVAENAIFGEQH